MENLKAIVLRIEVGKLFSLFVDVKRREGVIWGIVDVVRSKSEVHTDPISETPHRTKPKILDKSKRTSILGKTTFFPFRCCCILGKRLPAPFINCNNLKFNCNSFEINNFKNVRNG